MEDADTCGLFGKLPMQSDFINHFLPESFTDYWHSWLQACLSVSQEQLGENWKELYLTAPIWRFAIMPDTLHTQGIVGVVMPSVDEVGRYFPLTIAHMGNHQPWAAYLSGTSWFDEVQNTALLALEDGISYSQYVGYLETLRPPEFELWPQRNVLNNATNVSVNQVTHAIDHNDPQDGAVQLLHMHYQQSYGTYSLWWTEGSDNVDACLLSCRRIPDSGQFAAMLDGQWQHWQWAVDAIDTRETA